MGPVSDQSGETHGFRRSCARGIVGSGVDGGKGGRWCFFSKAVRATSVREFDDAGGIGPDGPRAGAILRFMRDPADPASASPPSSVRSLLIPSLHRHLCFPHVCY